MSALYHWIGFAVVWATTAAVGLGLSWLAWHHRPRNTFTRRVGNAWVWLTVFVFGRRWLVPLEGANLILTAYNRSRPRMLTRWERDTIAINLRYSRSRGWLPTR